MICEAQNNQNFRVPNTALFFKRLNVKKIKYSNKAVTVTDQPRYHTS